MSKDGYVYVMSNQKHGTLYIGVTSNLVQRVYQHKQKIVEWFTHKYDLNKLVRYQDCGGIEEAIVLEKQIKKWNRKRKIKRIEKMNPEWKDLYEDILE